MESLVWANDLTPAASSVECVTKSILSFYPQSTYQYHLGSKRQRLIQRYKYDKHAYLLRFVTSSIWQTLSFTVYFQQSFRSEFEDKQ